MFQTDEKSFPIKKRLTFVSSCSVSPMHSAVQEAVAAYSAAQMLNGISMFREFPDAMRRANAAVARLLNVEPENMSFTGNTAAGLSMIANGYPFEPGDEVISYAHEYPANHYPWRAQEKRGVILKLVSDSAARPENLGGRPYGFSTEQIEELITPRTRMVAVSHVQFTSGFAADLTALGRLCGNHGIDLVVDAAQSLGCLPLYPKEAGIAAVASSGWKWLLGPIGAGTLYTAPEFRKKIAPTMVGPETMRQGNDYLNLSWNPHESGRVFEYSTPPLALAHGLAVAVELHFSDTAIEKVRDRVFALSDLFLSVVDKTKAAPVELPVHNRSGINSFITSRNPAELCEELYRDGYVFTSRGGYFRAAPHCYLTEEEVVSAAKALNKRL